jgi:hypothetical protein
LDVLPRVAFFGIVGVSALGEDTGFPLAGAIIFFIVATTSIFGITKIGINV